MSSISNAQLAQKVSELIDRARVRDQQLAAWQAGAADGGPNSDGVFPLSDYLGASRNVRSPARLEEDVTSLVSGAEGFRDDAEAAADAAAGSASAASTSAGLANDHRSDALDAKSAAESAQSAAENAATTAIAQAQLAAGYATDSQAAESVATSAAEDAEDAKEDAEIAQAAAEAAASAAATFDPENYYAKADGVPWADVTGKPSTFPPSAHTHANADITNLAWSKMIGRNSGTLAANENPVDAGLYRLGSTTDGAVLHISMNSNDEAFQLGITRSGTSAFPRVRYTSSGDFGAWINVATRPWVDADFFHRNRLSGPTFTGQNWDCNDAAGLHAFYASSGAANRPPGGNANIFGWGLNNYAVQWGIRNDWYYVRTQEAGTWHPWRKVWHDGEMPAPHPGNSPPSGRQTITSHTNGHVYFGWINTTSGARTTQAPTRIYASDDAFLRYYSPANFRNVMGTPRIFVQSGTPSSPATGELWVW